MDLGVMNLNNPELNWNLVKKGRSSGRSLGRSFNSAEKLGDLARPKRDGEFSESDSDQCGEGSLGQSSAEKFESVPIKKRRHLLYRDSLSHCHSPYFEETDQRDFFGIELLVAAANMDDCSQNGGKEISVAEDSSLNPRSSDALIPGICLKNNESDHFSSDLVGKVENTNRSGIEISVAGEASLKAQSFNASTPGILLKNNVSEDFSGSLSGKAENTGRSDKDVSDAEDPSLNPRPFDASTPWICLKSNGSENFCSNFSGKVENVDRIDSSRSLCRSAEGGIRPKAVDRKHWDLNVVMDSWDQPYDSVSGSISFDAGTDSGKKSKESSDNAILTAGSGTISAFVSSGKYRCSSDSLDISQNFLCSHHSSDFDRTGSSDRIQSSVNEIVEHAELQCQNSKNSSAGGSSEYGQALLVADSKDQVDRSFAYGKSGSHGLSVFAEHVPNSEDDDQHFQELNRTTVEGPSSTAGALDGPRPFNGISDTSKIAQHVSDSEDRDIRGTYMYSLAENECVDYDFDGIQEDEADMDDCDMLEQADGVSEVYQGTDRSNMVPENYPEAEESNCRTVEPSCGLSACSKAISTVRDDFEAEGVSEVSHGIVPRNLVRKRPEAEGGECGPSEASLKKHIVTLECDKDEISRKRSSTGSDALSLRALEMAEENSNFRKRRLQRDKPDFFNLKMRILNERASNMARGKNQYFDDGRASTSAGALSGSIFAQPCRSHRPHNGFERDIVPEKYMSRQRSNHGARDGARWTNWTSGRPRGHQHLQTHGHNRQINWFNDSAEKIGGGQDVLDSRQTDKYPSKRLQRSIMRLSPFETEDYGGARSRMPPTRGVSNFRGRGHILHRADRCFANQHGDTGASEWFPHSRSPNCSRSSHIHFPRSKSGSRSRSQSPGTWHARMDYNMSRRRSRSPDYRTDSRMERTRVPLSKPDFAVNYGKDSNYPSRSRDFFSPQESYRLTEDSLFPENHANRRRAFGHPLRFDPGQLRPKENCSLPVIRSGRFSFMDSGNAH